MPKNHLFSVAIPFLPGRDGDFRIFAGCTVGKPRNQFSNFFFTLGTDKSKSVSPQLMDIAIIIRHGEQKTVASQVIIQLVNFSQCILMQHDGYYITDKIATGHSSPLCYHMTFEHSRRNALPTGWW
ncbi:Hypothetical protein c2122 [Escherichia coli CFT073]|uniref:Uncharacterized protein n=1 Tax=Escherichia coli O6:H1 (strain CFT073 / ATCC 700928 / UPEC) TaxID=199310 RepID=A0A0H2V7X8_ECOL6|nr:Hypothetical protein c2122 [Escherichia coli CFT073]